MKSVEINVSPKFPARSNAQQVLPQPHNLEWYPSIGTSRVHLFSGPKWGGRIAGEWKAGILSALF